MRNKQHKYLIKSTSSKFFLLLWVSSLLIGLVYAAGIIFPSSTPSWMTQNGSFSTRFANMFVSCPANEFLKGFDTNLNRVCVPSDGTYNGAAISSIPASTSGSYPGTPAGQITGGKFGNFFQKLSWLCPWNTIVKGFASDGWKYCVVPAIPTDYTLHTPVIPSGFTIPSTPSWQSAGGKFQDFFTNMFITCPGVQVIKGFDANGNPNCANNKQTLSCWGSIPTNATTSTVTTYVQTWNGSIWAPTTSWTNAAASCGFTCNTHYTWNGTSCVADTQTYACSSKPTTGTDWNTVASYTQTWNGTAWSPANSATVYNTTASTTACNYKCAAGYAWDGANCNSAGPITSISQVAVIYEENPTDADGNPLPPGVTIIDEGVPKNPCNRSVTVSTTTDGKINVALPFYGYGDCGMCTAACKLTNRDFAFTPGIPGSIGSAGLDYGSNQYWNYPTVSYDGSKTITVNGAGTSFYYPQWCNRSNMVDTSIKSCPSHPVYDADNQLIVAEGAGPPSDKCCSKKISGKWKWVQCTPIYNCSSPGFVVSW